MTAPRHHRKQKPLHPSGAADRKAMFDAMQSSLTARYGEEMGAWLARRVASLFRRVNDTYCVDNFRVCDTGLPEEVARYETQREQGCCGFADDRITHFKSGRTFRYGFNYGH